MDDRRLDLIGQKSLLRPDEVALELQISRAQVYRLMDEGRLPYLRISVKIRRIRRCDLQLYLKRCETLI